MKTKKNPYYSNAVQAHPSTHTPPSFSHNPSCPPQSTFQNHGNRPSIPLHPHTRTQNTQVGTPSPRLLLPSLPPSWLSSAASNHGESQSFFLFSPSLPPLLLAITEISPLPPPHPHHICMCGKGRSVGTRPNHCRVMVPPKNLVFFSFFFPGRASQKELHAGGVPPSLARSKIVRQSKLQYALA